MLWRPEFFIWSQSSPWQPNMEITQNQWDRVSRRYCGLYGKSLAQGLRSSSLRSNQCKLVLLQKTSKALNTNPKILHSPGHRQFCLYDDIIKMASWHNSRELISTPKFCPSILSTAFWSLESQFPWKRIDRASIQSNRKWRQFKCAEEIRIRSRTVAPKLTLEKLTCYQAKGNLR